MGAPVTRTHRAETVFKRILVPIDLSDRNRRSIDVALALARQNQALRATCGVAAPPARPSTSKHIEFVSLHRGNHLAQVFGVRKSEQETRRLKTAEEGA